MRMSQFPHTPSLIVWIRRTAVVSRIGAFINQVIAISILEVRPKQRFFMGWVCITTTLPGALIVGTA